MVAKIIGITSYTKKETGAVSYTLHFVHEFSQYDRESGAEGFKVDTVWTGIPEAAKVWVNDLVDLRFEPGFQGKAMLVDIVRYPKTETHILNAFNVPGIADPTAEPKPETKSETATTAKSGK